MGNAQKTRRIALKSTTWLVGTETRYNFLVPRPIGISTVLWIPPTNVKEETGSNSGLFFKVVLFCEATI